MNKIIFNLFSIIVIVILIILITILLPINTIEEVKSYALFGFISGGMLGFMLRDTYLKE